VSLIDRGLNLIGLQRRPRVRASAFAAARQNRLVLDWIWQHLSADQELQNELPVLRGRCREIARNDSFGKRYIRLQVKNVIGPDGIQLQARLTRGTQQNTELNTQIEAAWKDWGRRANCTVDRRLSWHGVQKMAIKSARTDGEFFCRMVRGFENPYQFAVQMLDPDQLDTSFTIPPSDRTNEIRMGVELNKWGEPVAYHFWKRNPYDFGASRERERIPAGEIIHLYDPDRVNQTRGIPPLAVTALDMHMLGGYHEAELVAARVAAAKMGFFVTKNPDGSASVPDPNSTARLTMDAEPALLEELPVGTEFQGWDPQHPTAAFPAFNNAVLHKIASGVDVSYASLTNDLSETSYSSSRVGLLDERDGYRDAQAWVIEGLHERVYTAWVSMAVLAGKLPARVRPEEYAMVTWVARGWDWVDPEKDVSASLLEVDNALTSRRRILAAQGLDLDEVVDDLVAEQKLFASKGLTVGTRALPARAPAVPPASRDEHLADESLEAALHQRRNGHHANGASR
jgi:lambda family phage portal protein